MIDALSLDEVCGRLERHGLDSEAACEVVRGSVIPMLPRLSPDEIWDLLGLVVLAQHTRAAEILEDAIIGEERRRSGIFPPP